MICSRPLQPHYNPTTYGIFIFITNLEKNEGGGGLYLPLQKGGGGNWPGGGIFTYIQFAHVLIMTLSTNIWNFEQIVCLWEEQ